MKKKVKKVIKRKLEFIKNPISNYIKKNNHRRVNDYAKYYTSVNVEKNTILYESRDGNSMTDSPYAMFKYMLNNPEYQSYTHIWSISNFELLSSEIGKYKDYHNVRFVERNSKKYLKYLASSEYLINNSTFQSFFIPQKEQIYINTWHGTPLKSMGFDIPGNPSHSQNVVRNFLSSDYILSPNAHTTKIFTDSYKLSGLYKGKIIEEGYPRIDLTVNTNSRLYKEHLKTLGIDLDYRKKTLLYAPTWKGTNVSKVNNDILQIAADLNQMEREIGKEYNILVKVHPFLYTQAAKFSELNSKLIPDFIDTNELLSTIDLLITDYSSIFFDFLVTSKPILFYTWDSDSYNEERGQYLSNENLPGPIVFNINELISSIKKIKSISKKFQQNYKKMQQQFVNYEDGKVTERVVKYIFKKETKELNTFSNMDASKEKILIYPGGMRDNGITSSFINLMNNIDFDKYDVSCFTATPHDKEVLKNISKVNKNVRFLFKPGLPVYKLFEVYRDKFIHNRGERGFLGKVLYPEKAYAREHARLFGKTKFDYVIDFSGYSLYWAKFMVSADAKKKICYMHNDLLSDSERMINGKRPHRINLRGLFSIYHRFDKLVSVSKGTMELNIKNLSMYASLDKFDYIMNSINPEKILQTQEKEEVIDISTTRKFVSRAIVKKSQLIVWSILPNQENAKEFLFNTTDNVSEIIISRESEVNGEKFYKFSYKNQMVGWVQSTAIKLLPDSIIEERNIDKIGILARPNGNHIWTHPYKVAGIKKVSGSNDYKNIVMTVDKEVRTQHGLYIRIAIKDIVLGWIDTRALNIYEAYTITQEMSPRKILQVKAMRQRLLHKNYKNNESFLENLENRTLYEKNISSNLFAKITEVENHTVWTKAFPNFDAKKIGTAKEYEGAIVRINTIHRTRKGTYYEFYINNNKVGWLDYRAFEIVNNQPIIINEAEVSKNAIVQLGKKDLIWTKPYGLIGAKTSMKNVEIYNEKLVYIDKEITTQKGTYSHILLNGQSLGWLDNRALSVEEELGVQVGTKFIPEPNKNNINFVNMGRLSPEKGQDNLIQAFAIFHRKHKNSKLYILGKGPLHEKLSSLIEELGLEDSVYLMGQLENPFSFIKKCNAFVLSSHYEGQPMVLLEAMTLGMKIVATDIVANRTVLEDGKYGFLVENSIDGLVEGLNNIANNDEKQLVNEFDYYSYNNLAMETFYKCL